jgi:hypothetical protein
MSRDPPLPHHLQSRNRKGQHIEQEDGNENPFPRDHMRDSRADVMAMLLRSQRQLQHGFVPVLGRPPVLRIGHIRTRDGFQDVLVLRLVGYEEDEDYGGEREEDGEQLQDKDCDERLRGRLRLVSTRDGHSHRGDVPFLLGVFVAMSHTLQGGRERIRSRPRRWTRALDQSTGFSGV